MKYQIDKELKPYCYLSLPVSSPKLAGFIGSLLKPPRKIFHDSEVHVRREGIAGYDGKEIEILIFEPRNLDTGAPCLVYYHGGGFVFGASWHHYNVCKLYAKATPCKLIFVQYRLAPRNPHPIPVEDCYTALSHVYNNAETLGIIKEKIAVGGDSAGGALAAAVCQMARDRGTDLPLMQMLIYPVTDRRMTTESQRRYTDTPMWDSGLSKMMWRAYLGDGDVRDIQYASPMEARDFTGLPQAYVETAEFDCLRDEGLTYAEALKAAGVSVRINETLGTIHGFDIARRAKVTEDALRKRIEALRSALYGEDDA